MARPRIFATGVYGSDFHVWGAQSFSDAKTRNKLGELMGPDDFCLTVGMTSELDVPEHERGRLLALTKIGPEQIMTADLVHPRKWQESLARYGPRWLYGFPVRSVERFDDPPLRSVILPRIAKDNLYMALARYFVELQPEEVERVLALPRHLDTNIYTTPRSAFATRLRKKHRGPKPSKLQTRVLSHTSGPADTYCLELVGQLAGAIQKTLRRAPEERVFKVGYTASIDRRLLEINAYMPCEKALYWREIKTQTHDDEINAWAMEQRIFDLLDDRGIECIKGEIFCATSDQVEHAWTEALITTERPKDPVIVAI